MDNKFRQSLVTLERRQNMVNICRLIAWGLLIGDALFTYFTLEAGGNKLFAASIAVAVAAMQWAIANAIYHKTLGDLFRPDHNEDGTTTLGEWLRLAIVVGSIAVAYWVDLATNTAGINAINTGLVLQVPLLSEGAPGVLAWILGAVLMLADETIHFFCDQIQSDIDERRPRLQRRAAQLAFLQDRESAYRAALIPRAKEIGTKQGEREDPEKL